MVNRNERVEARDGLVALPANEGTLWKGDYFRKYMDIFSVGMKNRWPNLAYVDPFCGPGLVVSEDGREHDGSPVMAVKQEHLKYLYLSDENPGYIDALKCRVGRIGTTGGKTVFISVNDAEQSLAGIPSIVPSGTLVLCILDAWKWDPSMSAVKHLVDSHKKTDLIIRFPTHQIKRIWQAGDFETKMGSFVGDLSWLPGFKAQMLRGSDNHGESVLLEAYKCELSSFRNYVPSPVVIPGRQRYHLFFASDHDMGRKFWNEVIKTNYVGQKSLSLFDDGGI